MKTFVGLAALLAAVSAWAATPSGSWRLVEQTYASGGRNLVAADAPVRLDLALGPAGPTGTLRSGGVASPWPSFVADGTPRPVTIVSRESSDGAVEVVYRVKPAADPTILEIRERYAVSADGATLDGTVEVTFLQDGAPRGGYVLHRRFAREP